MCGVGCLIYIVHNNPQPLNCPVVIDLTANISSAFTVRRARIISHLVMTKLHSRSTMMKSAGPSRRNSESERRRVETGPVGDYQLKYKRLKRFDGKTNVRNSAIYSMAHIGRCFARSGGKDGNASIALCVRFGEGSPCCLLNDEFDVGR